MILDREKLLPRMNELLNRSKRVDVAVAWASQCDALDSFLQFGGRKRRLRMIVSISGNATHPNALKSLRDVADLRIAGNSVLFHPKVYLFHLPKERIAWVGSANLTRLGFQQNHELVHEFTDTDGAVLKWFEEHWATLPRNCSQLIDDYDESWVPQKAHKTSRRGNAALADKFKLPGLETLTTWRSFVQALAQADRYWKLKHGWTVTGEAESWLNTIILGRAVVRRKLWDDLSTEDRHLLLGRSGYGLLGSMGGAGSANNVFKENSRRNLSIRRNIREALEPVLNADADAFPSAANEFLLAVNEYDRFSGGIATRLLALARPDCAISVNDAARKRLSEASGLPPSTLANPSRGTRAKSYVDLLNWFRKQDWYANPQPVDQFEQLLANNRAALADALIYEPV